MNSRTADVLNRLELVAKKMMVSVEDAILILEGKHPTHHVTEKPAVAPVVPVVEEPPVVVTPTPAAPSAVITENPPAPEPSTNMPVGASGEVAGQQAAGSTESGSLAEIEGGVTAESAAQNQAAAGAEIDLTKTQE